VGRDGIEDPADIYGRMRIVDLGFVKKNAGSLYFLPILWTSLSFPGEAGTAFAKALFLNAE
jgi:hypothetical protein